MHSDGFDQLEITFSNFKLEPNQCVDLTGKTVPHECTYCRVKAFLGPWVDLIVIATGLCVGVKLYMHVAVESRRFNVHLARTIS